MSQQLNHRPSLLPSLLLPLLLLVLLSLTAVNADEHDHVYDEGDEVVLWMNTVGPYANRQETYAYFSLPFCHGPKESIGHYHETLGEALQGVELELAGVDIDFNMPVRRIIYCHVTLTEETAGQFAYAVRNRYWYQMFIDDLPIWGIVGDISGGGAGSELEDQERQPERLYLWTHRRLHIGVNGRQIVDVNLTSSTRRLIRPGARIAFSYEVIFRPSNVPFDKRFDKYLDPGFFHHRIHWLSLLNSFALAAFLLGLVIAILMRTLRRDFARYSRADERQFELERNFGDEFGWKQVHGDVFRPPARPLIFSVLVGSGAQLACTLLCLLLVAAALTDLTSERSGLASAALFLYAITCPVGGCIGAALYARCSSVAHSSSKWLRQAICQALLPPGLAVCLALPVNLVALAYQASRSLSPEHCLALLAILTFVVTPLSLLGSLLGRRFYGQPPELPCRLNAVPRPLPAHRRCFTEPPALCLLAGILPFASIFVEMYYVFTSFWAYKIYYVYGFGLLAFLFLLCAAACATIVAVYCLLNAEDYRWQWAAFLSGATVALYLYVYAIYYYFFKTKMFGLYQTVFYFAYMALFACGVALVCGAAGFLAASLFVRRIYASVKTD